MRKGVIVFLFVAVAALWQCAHKDLTPEITRLEKALDTQYSDTAADSLVALYQQAVQLHPGDTATNLDYLNKAAAIQFFKRKNTVDAVRTLNGALKQYGQGADLGPLFGTMARIWSAYLYKSTPDLSRRPEDIDEMHANLLNNMSWIDSSLLRLDRGLMSNPRSGAINLADADAFIEISEAYASLLTEKNDPDKCAHVLMQAGGLAKSVGNPNKALQLYYKVEHQMPDHAQAPAALFLSGFIYENDLRNLEKARAAYEDFLKRYPNDPSYLDDVQVSLNNLGKSAEELIREFEKKQKVQ